MRANVLVGLRERKFYFSGADCLIAVYHAEIADEKNSNRDVRCYQKFFQLNEVSSSAKKLSAPLILFLHDFAVNVIQVFELFIADPELAITLRRGSDEIFELIVEVADVVIAELHADFRDGFVRGD